MKVIIAGSRTIDDYEIVAQAVTESGFWVTEVVSGGARGPDSLGELWAFRNSVYLSRFPADWNLGKRAGILRNEEMGRYADALVAIWDGKSRGTRHMIDFMLSLGKPVHVRRA